MMIGCRPEVIMASITEYSPQGDSVLDKRPFALADFLARRRISHLAGSRWIEDTAQQSNESVGMVGTHHVCSLRYLSDLGQHSHFTVNIKCICV